MGVTTTVRGRIGRRTVHIHAVSGDDTAGQLAAACGFGSLLIDGRLVDDACPLALSGLAEGSALADGSRVPPGDEPAPAPTWAGAVVTGPDCGPLPPLPAGRHLLGRAGVAAIRIDDRRLEPHHALVDLPPADGDDVRVIQLVGPGELVARRHDDGATIEVGDSRVELHRTDPATGTVARPIAGASWRHDHHRPIRRPAPDPPPVIDAPAAETRPGPATVPAAILPALLGALCAGVAAVVLHQPLVLLFGLSALVAAGGTWTAQHVSRLRQRGRRDRERAAQLDRFAAAVAAQCAAERAWRCSATPDVVDALARIHGLDPRLWERRPAHADAWRVALGRGDLPWRARTDHEAADADLRGDADHRIRAVTDGHREPDDEVAALLDARAQLPDVPLTTDLAPGSVLGLCGAAAPGVARSLLVQLAAHVGPADWELVVVSGRPERWRWACWLPHEVTVLDPEQANVTTLPAPVRHRLFVVDGPALLAARTSPLRRALDTEPPPAAIVLAGDVAALPSFCTAVLSGGHGAARWFARPGHHDLPLALRPAGVGPDRAIAAAARLARLRDPESDGGSSGAPSHVALATALGDRCSDALAVDAAWSRAGYDPPPVATIGAAADGTIEIDLQRDGPHALIGGTTGAGKSELLRSLVVGLAARTPPELLSFVLVDYKGGAAFDACAALPHVAGLVTDLDERLAARALRSLDAEVRRRERLLRTAGASDLSGYRLLTGGREPLARLVVVVDEFATLAADLPSFLPALVAVAQRGRSLGIHLVLATQRPGTAISDDIRANTNLRIALRVQDAADAIDVVGDAAPAAFPRASPGRAMLRLGADERVVFQVADSSGPLPVTEDRRLRVVLDDGGTSARGTDGATQLVELVRRIADAAIGRPHARSLWTDPLPDGAQLADRIESDGDGGPHPGVVDDPEHQQVRPLVWEHAQGHLAVVGSLGSGTTSTAITTLRALAARWPPERLHVYAIGNDARLRELGALPHCGAVVALSERERLERLVRVLRARVESPGDPHVVLLVDGLPAARTAIDALGGDLHERFEELLASGPTAGLTALVTSDQAVLPISISARATQRWVLRLADASSAALLDLRSHEVLGDGAPAGRLVALPERLEAQIVAPATSASWPVAAGHASAPPIELLPACVPAASVGHGRRAGSRIVLPLGLDGALLEPRAIELADREHLLVLGTPGSGRSQALARLAIAWSEAVPDGSVVVVTPRASPLTAVATARGWYHADAADARAIGACDHTNGGGTDGDAGGRGARLVVVDDAELVDDPAMADVVAAPGTTVFAAARPDALRGAYQHWTSAVRRSRTGLVLGRPTEHDGDQLGVVLPRRWPAPHAPGRGWLVVGGACHGLLQVALDGERSPDRTGTAP